MPTGNCLLINIIKLPQEYNSGSVWCGCDKTIPYFIYIYFLQRKELELGIFISHLKLFRELCIGRCQFKFQWSYIAKSCVASFGRNSGQLCYGTSVLKLEPVGWNVVDRARNKGINQAAIYAAEMERNRCNLYKLCIACYLMTNDRLFERQFGAILLPDGWWPLFLAAFGLRKNSVIQTQFCHKPKS